jgi:hypothetical protein
MCPAVLPDVVSRELLGCRLEKLSVSAVQLYAAVEPRLKLLFLAEFLWQHGLPHLGGRQGRGLVLQRLSTTYQSLPKVLQQAVQHCRILLPEESHDVVLASGGDVVHFAVAVLKAASLGLEGFEFRDAEASKAGYASGREAIFLECVVEEKRREVPANERAVDSHQVNVCDVVHELEELDLCPRGLRNELLHTMQRRHVRLFSSEITSDVADDLFRVAQLEENRSVVVGEIVSDKDGQGPKHHVQVVAFMA